MHKDNGAPRAALDVEDAVARRYSAGARQAAAELCCPVTYDARYLEVIPREVVEKDYGCGDPSRHLRRGETVLDLGSGTGKGCFIASQIVGPEGRVIGVDMNDDMLEVARRHAPTVAERVGYRNVEFRKGRIQDLSLDLEALEAYLEARPVSSAAGYLELDGAVARLRQEAPLVPSDSIDVVVSNCVLNLVRPDAKHTLFEEIFRVLRRGGRAVISDIVCDEDVPLALQNDPDLWSGCIGGAFREDRLLQAFEAAGFHGIRILERGTAPWATVEGIEFRSLTVEAFKGKQGPCWERRQAVIYRGPWKKVLDDDGHELRRGERMAVCDKTYHLYLQEPYRQDVLAVPPREEAPLEGAPPFDCSRSDLRDPRETKGRDYRETARGEECCGPSCC